VSDLPRRRKKENRLGSPKGLVTEAEIYDKAKVVDKKETEIGSQKLKVEPKEYSSTDVQFLLNGA
jgi:hypothetical protein